MSSFRSPAKITLSLSVDILSSTPSIFVLKNLQIIVKGAIDRGDQSSTIIWTGDCNSSQTASSSLVLRSGLWRPVNSVLK